MALLLLHTEANLQITNAKVSDALTPPHLWRSLHCWFNFHMIPPQTSTANLLSPVDRTGAPARVRRLARATLPGLTAVAALLTAFGAHAGMSYRLDTIRAVSGEEIRVQGTLFNDTGSALNWTPPKKLVLQWRDSDGKVVRSLAYLESAPEQVDLPVNNFAAF